MIFQIFTNVYKCLFRLYLQWFEYKFGMQAMLICAFKQYFLLSSVWLPFSSLIGRFWSILFYLCYIYLSCYFTIALPLSFSSCLSWGFCSLFSRSTPCHDHEGSRWPTALWPLSAPVSVCPVVHDVWTALCLCLYNLGCLKGHSGVHAVLKEITFQSV